MDVQEWIFKSAQSSLHSEKEEESLKAAKVDMSALKDKLLRGATLFFPKIYSVKWGNLD